MYSDLYRTINAIVLGVYACEYNAGFMYVASIIYLFIFFLFYFYKVR